MVRTINARYPKLERRGPLKFCLLARSAVECGTQKRWTVFIQRVNFYSEKTNETGERDVAEPNGESGVSKALD